MLHPEAEELSYPDFESSGLAMTVIYAAAATTFIAAMHALSRPIGAVELAAGALLWWAVADLTVGLFAPLASALTIWPLLGGTVALAVVTFLRRPWAAALLALAAVPSLVFFIPLIVLNALQPEDGATQPVALLLLVLGTLLLQFLPNKRKGGPVEREGCRTHQRKIAVPPVVGNDTSTSTHIRRAGGPAASSRGGSTVG